MSLKVLLIDDHMLFREGLISLLQRRNIEVLAAVGDGNEGIKLAQELKPDIVLLDKRMPIIDGISVLKHLKKLGLEMPIVMLTTSSNEQDLLDALKAGASGYLLKDMEPDGLVTALRDIHAGKTVVALHRAAYLLYTHRAQLERSGVLVIGPTPTFIEYVSRVLPSLGETGVLLVPLGELYPGVVADTHDQEARTLALHGSHLAGRALELTSMGLHHKLCHVLGGSFGLSHAAVHAVLLPHVAAFNAPAAPEAMQRLARALGAPDPIAGLVELNRRLENPSSLAELGLTERDIAAVATQAVTALPVSMWRNSFGP